MGKRGGSGFRFKIPNTVAKTLRNKTKKANKRPELPTRRPNSHPNLTDMDLENLHVVNTNTAEWRVVPGNGNRYVPKNLRPAPKTMKLSNMGPGVRVFHTGIKPEQVPNW